MLPGETNGLTPVVVVVVVVVVLLLQVTGNFDLQDFNKMCWTLSFRKNLDQSLLLISNDDAFKIWCIFNFLSEDTYPLTVVTDEVSRLLTSPPPFSVNECSTQSVSWLLTNETIRLVM